VANKLLKILKERHVAKYYKFYITICLFPSRAMASSVLRFPDHTPRRTTVRRTSLDERSARRKDLYLTTHNTPKRRIHANGGIRTYNFIRQGAADPRHRPRGHWDRRFFLLLTLNWQLWLN